MISQETDDHWNEDEFIKQSEETIQKLEKKQPTIEMKSKAYECTKCGAEEEHETNHWGNIYNIPCKVCSTLTEWKVSEEIPEGAWIPEPWTQTLEVTAKKVTLTKTNWPFFKLAYTEAEKNRKDRFTYGGVIFLTHYARMMIQHLDSSVKDGWSQTIMQPSTEDDQ